MEAQLSRKLFFDPKYKRQLPVDPIPGALPEPMQLS